MPSSPSPPTTPPLLPSPPIPQILTTPPEQSPQSRVLFFSKNPDARRTSVQFVTHHAEAALRNASPKPNRLKTLQQRFSSPPPPSTYASRVSFDTFDNRDATDFAFTLKSTHMHYAYTKRSRTFLCGTDQNDYSEFALEWLLDELVDDGDEVVCLRVIDKDSKINSDNSLEEGRYRTEAKRLMDHIKAKNKDDEKSISLILEFAVGKIQETIQRMIAMYEPACLIVGTRGRSLGGLQGLLPGSVSKYCLQNSPVPVIVVRPSAKREKKKRKRRADPTRRSYMDILEKSGARGSQVLDKLDSGALAGQPDDEAIAKEANAVAKAIGVARTSPAFVDIRRGSVDSTADGAMLTKVTSTKSDYTSGPDSPSPTGGMSPDASFNDEPPSPEEDGRESSDESYAEEDTNTEHERDLFGSHKPSRSSNDLPRVLR